MPSVQVDPLVDGDLVMHSHEAGDVTDLTVTLDSRYLNTTGDTMTGALVITPSANSTSILNVTDQAGTNTFTVDTTNQKTTIRGKSEITALGSTLVTNGNFDSDASSWTLGSNWSYDGTAKTAKHTAGSTATLTQAVTVTQGAVYLVNFTIKTRTAGTVAVSLNGTGAGVNYNSSDAFAPVITAGASGGLVFTPSPDFDGSIDTVSVKLVVPINNTVDLKDNAGTTRVEIRPIDSSVAYGENALRYLSKASSDNVAIGRNALANATDTFRNVAIGSGALLKFSSSNTGYNVAIGGNTLLNNETGVQNTAIGYGALQKAKYSINNVAIGYATLALLDGRNSDGNSGNNIAIGTQAGGNATTGYNNTIIANQGMSALTTGVSNLAIGNGALNAVSTTGSNVGLGALAGYNYTGSSGIFIGAYAGAYLTTGNNQVAIGAFTGGRSAGTGNTYVGGLAGYGSFVASGSANNNTFIGYEAGRQNYISNSVLIGYQAGYNETNSDRLYIANSNTATPLIYGIFSGTTAGLTIHSQNALGVPLTVKGITSQSGNMQDWVTSASSKLAFIDSTGKFVSTNIGIGLGGLRADLVEYGNTAGEVLNINRTITGASVSGNYRGINLLVNSGSIASGTITALDGLNFQVNAGTTPTTTMRGYNSNLTYTAAATVTNAYGFSSEWAFNANALITNLVGYNLSTINATPATVTNAYGLRVNDVYGATNNFAIQTNRGNVVFNEGGDDSTDFRVESDTEENMFFLDANADTDGALYLGGSTNGIKINKGGVLTFLGTANISGGATGSFTTTDGKTVTVTGGIITAIV